MTRSGWHAVSESPGLAARIDTIERGYEYLLAYAAQGRQEETGTEARATLVAMHAALIDLAGLASAELGKGADADVLAYLHTVTGDAQSARGAIALVLSRPRISSLLVDNLNASVHLRALLTDVFLIEQALKT
jgi:hypothetical protein